MRTQPQNAFRCGPMALERILAATKETSKQTQDLIVRSESSDHGMSLLAVRELSDKVGLNYQMANRSRGAPFIVPSVINWKVGHYAALTKEANGKFLAQDPTFRDDVLVSRQAIENEGSGYYLVPAGKLPAGWRPVPEAEAASVWGKGTAGANSEAPPPCIALSIHCPTGDC